MNITTATLQENGVLLNGVTSLPDSNTGHVQHAYQAWLAKGNKPAPQYSEEENALAHIVSAKAVREAALNSGLAMLNAVWQVDNDAWNIRNVISDALFIGASETDTVSFRLADNTWRKTSLAELKQILQAYIVRKQRIWAQFGAWDNGDKLTEFVVTL